MYNKIYIQDDVYSHEYPNYIFLKIILEKD